MSNQIPNKVELQSASLGTLLGLEVSAEGGIIKKEGNYQLFIPDYQRIYCWEEKNVITLLDDINGFSDKPYHLGSIILHKTNERNYHIVDGQQRLVTLCLILLEMQDDIDTQILNEKFESAEAQSYIGYNRWLIKNYITNYPLNKQQILENLQFSVLIISSGSLDLAYTFFSNQNARGKALTDYDLLKAHHLRYVYIPEQAKYLAERWDTLVLNSDNDASDKDLGKTFGLYLFRLRKWMRKKEWSNDEKYKVKTEFEAALIIPYIPPFGEQFQFYESIQGGAHFFAYAEHFIYLYQMFSKTNEYKALEGLKSGTHERYKDIIEALLFAYYLKFGTLYLGDALLGIARIISEHRYINPSTRLPSLLKYAGNSEIVMMIDQSTSLTFFLAEMLNIIKKLPKYTDLGGIRLRYFNLISNINNQIDSHHNIFPI